MKKKIILFWLVSLFLLVSVAPSWAAAAKTKAPTPNAVYVSPQGVKFVSYSKAWNANKLKALSSIFNKLPKGEEIKKLSKIVLMDGGPKDSNGRFNHSFSRSKSKTSMNAGAWIDVYHVEKRTTPESVAYTLSHEYGHLFTLYWLMKKEQRTPNDPNSGWAKIRKLEGYPIAWKKPGRYMIQHMWDPAEIMADDYAMLFGPLEAKSDMLKDQRYPYSLDMKPENLFVPAAESIAGLRTYWSKLSGVKLSAPTLPTLRVTGLTAKAGKDDFGNDAIVYEPTLQGSVIQDKGYQYTVFLSNQSKVYGDYRLEASLYQDGSSPLVYSSTDMKGTWSVRIFVVDLKTGRTTYSTHAWFNFDDPLNPKSTNNPIKW